MKRIIRKVKMPSEVFVNSVEFEEMMEKGDYKIVALKNNELSKKYFDDDSKYLIFNIQFGLEKGYYTNSLRNECLVDEILIIQ